MLKKSNSHPHSAEKEQSDKQPEATKQTFPVVGVGASTDGLDAFTKLLWNRRAQEMFGYTEAEALQLDASLLIPETAQEETRDLIERIKRSEHVPPCETRRRTRDSREIKVSLTASALLDESGNPAAIVTTEKEI